MSATVIIATERRNKLESSRAAPRAAVEFIGDAVKLKGGPCRSLE